MTHTHKSELFVFISAQLGPMLSPMRSVISPDSTKIPPQSNPWNELLKGNMENPLWIQPEQKNCGCYMEPPLAMYDKWLQIQATNYANELLKAGWNIKHHWTFWYLKYIQFWYTLAGASVKTYIIIHTMFSILRRTNMVACTHWLPKKKTLSLLCNSSLPCDETPCALTFASCRRGVARKVLKACQRSQ